MAARKKRSWWKVLLVCIGWLLALAVALFIWGIWNESHPGPLPVWVWVIFGVMVFNYAWGTLNDKLDTIIWSLQDIQGRLGAGHSDFDLDV